MFGREKQKEAISIILIPLTADLGIITNSEKYSVYHRGSK